MYAMMMRNRDPEPVEEVDFSKTYQDLHSILEAAGSGTAPSFAKCKVAGFVVGAGTRARKAVLALDKLGLSLIFLINRDSEEMYTLINEYKTIDIQGLRTPGMAQRELDDLIAKAIPLAIGVNTIPNLPPSGPREEYVHKIAETLFQHKYQAQGNGESNEAALKLPERPCFVDIKNEPGQILMESFASEHGWRVSSAL